MSKVYIDEAVITILVIILSLICRGFGGTNFS